MKIKHLHRIIFCAFWLYFFAFRGVLGNIRFVDYLSISLVPIGIVLLAVNARLPSNLVKRVTILMCPIFISVAIDPSLYIISFVLKLYLVALYLVLYFKIMKLTLVELACFTFPVIISVYYFIYPRPEDYIYLLQDRMAGISEPNFTSLSLIISMCGAFGIYMFIKNKLIKVLMIITIFTCCWGIILTASRAGFISAIIALSLFLVIKKAKWHNILILITAAIYIGSNANTIIDMTNRLLVFARFENLYGRSDSLIEAIIEERPFTEHAWNTVRYGEWFIGGGAHRVSEWGVYNLAVPHNSVLEIGLGFGKANFYFYSILLIFLLCVNILVYVKNRNNIDYKVRWVTISSIFFISLLPMYIFLASGLTLGFIFWMTIGVYPLLHLATTSQWDLHKLLFNHKSVSS